MQVRECQGQPRRETGSHMERAKEHSDDAKGQPLTRIRLLGDLLLTRAQEIEFMPIWHVIIVLSSFMITR